MSAADKATFAVPIIAGAAVLTGAFLAGLTLNEMYKSKPREWKRQFKKKSDDEKPEFLDPEALGSTKLAEVMRSRLEKKTKTPTPAPAA